MIKEKTILYLTCKRCGKVLDDITSLVSNEESVIDNYRCSCGEDNSFMIGNGVYEEINKGEKIYK